MASLSELGSLSSLIPPPSSLNQAVSNSGNSQNQRGVTRIDLDFFAEAAHMDVDRALAIDVSSIAPHRVEDLRARQRLPGMLREIDEQPKFDRGEVERLIATFNVAARAIDYQIA